VHTKKLVGMAALLTVAACSSRQNANETNLTEAVTAGLAVDPGWCRSIAAEWPETVVDSDMDTQLMLALSNAGVLKAEPVSVPRAGGMRFPGHRYTLTDEGRKYVTGGTLCYGKPKLVKLVSWDPIVKFGSISTTKAYYTYEIQGLPAWASRQDVQAALPGLRSVVQGQKSSKLTMPMVLADGHWQRQ
jgi:hypothetical protein